MLITTVPADVLNVFCAIAVFVEDNIAVAGSTRQTNTSPNAMYFVLVLVLVRVIINNYYIQLQ
jgi:hypothetical protein